MAGALPILSGKKVRKAFEKGGWEFVRQRGSHMILVKLPKNIWRCMTLQKSLYPSILCLNILLIMGI